MRLLFIPVSGRYGMGEYARSLAIASAAGSRWPGTEILFILSREAPYAAATPFATLLLPASATFHSAEVIESMHSFRPDIVFFDNAGRTSQLRAARRLAARIVYISARARQRRKAFRLGWMRMIDEHWIAYPRFIAGALTPLERFKLGLIRRPVVRYLDVMLPPDVRHGGERGSTADAGYVLLVPGGGTGHPGALHAVAQFESAARRLASEGNDVILIASSLDRAADAADAADAGHAAAPRLRILAPVPPAQLLSLMQGARVVLANGGSTLLQAMACGRACIAVPIAADQRRRIDACVSAGVATASALSAASMAAAAGALLRDERQRIALARRASQLDLANGVEIALEAIGALLARG